KRTVYVAAIPSARFRIAGANGRSIRLSGPFFTERFFDFTYIFRPHFILMHGDDHRPLAGLGEHVMRAGHPGKRPTAGLEHLPYDGKADFGRHLRPRRPAQWLPARIPYAIQPRSSMLGEDTGSIDPSALFTWRIGDSRTSDPS